MSFLYYHYESKQSDGAMHREKSPGVGSDGMIEMALLFHILHDKIYPTVARHLSIVRNSD